MLKARKNATLQSSSAGAAGAGGGSSLSAKAAQFIKKANMTAYITFCTLRRNEVKNLYPSASSFSAIGKLLGWLWAKITDEEKKVRLISNSYFILNNESNLQFVFI